MRKDSTADVLQSLTASGIFRRTDPHVAWVYAKQLKLRQFPPGCVVDADGEDRDHLYVIVSGKVKVSYRCPDGREILLNLLGPSEIYGALALFDPTWRRTCAITLTVVRAVAIPRDQLLTCMAERPEVADQVLRLFSRRAKAATNALVDFSRVEIRARIASRLLCLTKQFGWRDGEVVRVVHDLTLEDFSLLVGAPPAKVAEILNEFEDRGWIRVEDNGVVIADVQALCRERVAAPEICRG